MNGPEHLAEAERLLTRAQRTHDFEGRTLKYYAESDIAEIAAAQVHATLATIPPDHLAVYDWTQQRLVERLTEDHCLQAFKDAWMRADAEHDDGNRVRRGMAAAIAEARL